MLCALISALAEWVQGTQCTHARSPGTERLRSDDEMLMRFDEGWLVSWYWDSTAGPVPGAGGGKEGVRKNPGREETHTSEGSNGVQTCHVDDA